MSYRIVPKAKPLISRAELLTTYPQLQNLLAAEEGKLCLVIIPGYYAKTMGATPGNDRGIYDDCMVVLSPSVYATFNANTDPSIFRGKTNKKQGIATLKAGVHPYRMGNHGISRPGGGYPAFRPATKGEGLPVWRDGDKNQNAVGYAINIHKGGYNTTSSEGCQTIFPDQWEAFYALVKGEMGRNGQKTFNLIKL